MNVRSLVISVLLPGALLVVGSSVDAAETVGTAGPTPVVKAPPKALRIGTLKVNSTAAVPGETRVLEALFTSGAADTPLAGKSVAFRIEGKNGTSVPGGAVAAGTAVTDASGKAKLSFAIPELAQGAYRLIARFAGDDDTASSTGEANLGMVKGLTKLELSDLSWGTYKGESSAPFGTVFVTVRRVSDGSALAKKVRMTVNGKVWEIGGSSTQMSIPLTAPPSTWNVKAQFMGDDANQPVEASRTYTKP